MRRARAMLTRCLKTNSTSLIDWCARRRANSIASTSSPFHSSHCEPHLLGAVSAATNCCVNSMHCVDVLLGARRGVACRHYRHHGGDWPQCLSTRRSRPGAGGGLLLYSFDTLCRWLAWRMMRSRLCSRLALVLGVVNLALSVPTCWRDAVRDVSCRPHLQQISDTLAKFSGKELSIFINAR
jgi:hypothetical protein